MGKDGVNNHTANSHRYVVEKYYQSNIEIFFTGVLLIVQIELMRKFMLLHNYTTSHHCTHYRTLG